VNKPASMTLSRRQVLGVGIALSFGVPRAQSQTPPEIAPDGFRILRVPPEGAAVDRLPPAPPSPDYWSYGSYPGPTLRLRRGEELRVRLVNGMKEPTTLHWRGVRAPNAMDGAPFGQQPVKGGASFDYRFTPPDAGTFWYHPTPAQTEHGLSGLLIVDESEPVAVARDHALVFLNAAAPAPDDLVWINGQFGLEFPTPAAQLTRLRLVNAAARALVIQFGELSPEEFRIWVMAIDGQPAEPFLARGNRISLAPGNRADVFVETTLAPGTKVPIKIANRRDPPPHAYLMIEGQPRSAALASPKPLPANPLPQRLDLARAQRATVPIESATTTVPPPRPLFSVRRGRAVVLAFVNRTDAAQVIHLRGHSARLLDRLDDGWKPFWLDTLLVEPHQTDRIAFLADNLGKWAIDTSKLERGSGGFAGWFEVT
jgi:FtsP/CotA-like multicopper oxidase with cupredoxin domain